VLGGGGGHVRRGNKQNCEKQCKKEEAVKRGKKAVKVDSKLCAEFRT
jgi:hypothetical protein